MDPDKIPAELRGKRKWVSFRVLPQTNGNGKPVKVPYIPGTDFKASPTNPDDWGTFEDAAKHGMPAYCLTKDDKLVFLDLDGAGDHPISDDLAEQLLEVFDSYTELSQSQNGMHIIGRGNLRYGKGLRRQGVELYDRARFVIFTGDVTDDRYEIKDLDPEWLQKLETDMGSTGITAVDMAEIPEKETDSVVLERCRLKSSKFAWLWNGKWQEVGEYPSQSEADHALIGLIASETWSNEQVARLFEKSGLYRTKATRKYIRRSLLSIRANQQKELEADLWVEKLIETSRENAGKLRVKETYLQNDPDIYENMPTGLLSDLFHAYMDFAHYPMKEGALVASMVTLLALFSRAYQTETQLALNLYLFLIGPTGFGKDIIKLGPTRLFKAAKVDLGGVMGGEIRSSPAIDDILKLSPRHVAYHGECDAWLRALCDERAPLYMQQARARLTDVFTKGASEVALRSIATKKGEVKEHAVPRPCLSIYGESVPDKFYCAIGTGQIQGGFLPRFTVLEVDEDSISLDPGPQKPFSEALLMRIKDLADRMTMEDVTDHFQLVPMTEDARKKYFSFARELRQRYVDERKTGGESITDIMRSRCAEKVLKIATLAAIGKSPLMPVVTMTELEWAICFVRSTDGRLCKHLSLGEHDPAMHRQFQAVEKKLLVAKMMPKLAREKTPHWTSSRTINTPECVPWGWIRQELRQIACFKNDRRGIGPALLAVLRDMEMAGQIVLIPKEKAFSDWGQNSLLVLNLAGCPDDPEIF